MMMRKLLFALATIPFAFVAGADPSFDCRKAQTAAENRVCSVRWLQWSDRQVARLYALALKEAPEDGRAALIESQRRFLAGRDACPASSPACVDDIYHRRLQELAARVNVYDAYVRYARGTTGGLRIVRLGFVGAVDLWATGPNDHECAFEDDDLLQTGKGILRFRARPEDGACRMNIVPEGDDVRVEIEEGCRLYCGHRARMDGTFKRVK